MEDIRRLKNTVTLQTALIVLLTASIIYNHTKRDLKTVKQELLNTMSELVFIQAKLTGSHLHSHEERFIELVVKMNKLIVEKSDLEGSKEDKLQDMIDDLADDITK